MKRRAKLSPDRIPYVDASRFSTALRDDDAAGLERLEGGIQGFGAGLDAQVRALRSQRLDDDLAATRQVAPRNRRTHGVGDDRGRQHLVEAADGRHDRMREVEHLAS